MGQFESAIPEGRSHGDHILIASILLLTGLGLVTLYSASYAFSERFYKGDGLYLISRQIILGASGFVLFLICSKINLNLLRRLVKPIVLISIILCCMTFVPAFGVSKNGASRWVKIGGFTYQPSEMVKFALPLYLAHIFAKKGRNIGSLSKLIPPVLVTTFFALLINLQNNFSTALFLVMNALIIFYFAGIKFRYFLSAFFIVLPIASLLVLRKEHRLRRLFSFLYPELDPLGAGYQVRSSVLSLSSGGFWGKGIGQGTRKIASVPEIHSDFIFSAFAEESGFLGVLFYIFLFAIFAIRGYRAAMGNVKIFPRLLGLGLVTMVVTQSLLNIAVVSGAVPTTGIPLPFFSAGGSSLATTLAAAGLIVNISRTRDSYEYEPDPVPGEA
jgi:cell division protein FtsW